MEDDLCIPALVRVGLCRLYACVFVLDGKGERKKENGNEKVREKERKRGEGEREINETGKRDRQNE